MIIAGITLLSLGVVGVISSTIMEWKQHARIYALLMKVFPTIFAIGAICFGIALAQ
jgi:hypothetical protein